MDNHWEIIDKLNSPTESDNNSELSLITHFNTLSHTNTLSPFTTLSTANKSTHPINASFKLKTDDSPSLNYIQHDWTISPQFSSSDSDTEHHYLLGNTSSNKEKKVPSYISINYKSLFIRSLVVCGVVLVSGLGYYFFS